MILHCQWYLYCLLVFHYLLKKIELAQCNMFQKLLDRFDYDDEPEAVEDTKKDEPTAPAISQPTL